MPRAVRVDHQRRRRRTRGCARDAQSPFVGTGREQLDERAERRVDGVVVSIPCCSVPSFWFLETIILL